MRNATLKSVFIATLAVLLFSACQPIENPIADQDFSGGADSLEATPVTNADDFIEGNLYFIAFHEMGHALVSELGLPIAGREEDAVDRLAIWIMTPVETSETPDYLMGAMQGWFMSAGTMPLDDIAWWDEHGTDQQRAYQIACLLYGDAPERFAAAADVAAIPEDRRETCVFEALDNDYAWTSLLDPFARAEGDVAPEDTITIRYAPPGDYTAEAKYLRDLGVLEDVSAILREYYVLEPGITLEGARCEQPNAFWSSETRTLTLCYELVADYVAMAEALPDASSAPITSAP